MQIVDFYILEFFFSRSGSQRPKNLVGVFLNSIAFKGDRTFLNHKKNMPSERTVMAFKERILRTIEFLNTFLLIIIFASIWPNLTEIGQIVFELKN